MTFDELYTFVVFGDFKYRINDVLVAGDGSEYVVKYFDAEEESFYLVGLNCSRVIKWSLHGDFSDIKFKK